MKFWHEPLVHFVALGALLFVVFGFVGRTGAADPGHEIRVTPGMVENLRVSFARAEGHPPDAATLRQLVDGFVREEILCREARQLGLDRDDTVIRTILVKRMEYLAASDGEAPPTDAVLQHYLETHPRLFGGTGAPPPLAEIREAVLAAWRGDARAAAVDRAYQELRGRYRIVLPPATELP